MKYSVEFNTKPKISLYSPQLTVCQFHRDLHNFACQKSRLINLAWRYMRFITHIGVWSRICVVFVNELFGFVHGRWGWSRLVLACCHVLHRDRTPADAIMNRAGGPSAWSIHLDPDNTVFDGWNPLQDVAPHARRGAVGASELYR